MKYIFILNLSMIANFKDEENENVNKTSKSSNNITGNINKKCKRLSNKFMITTKYFILILILNLLLI